MVVRESKETPTDAEWEEGLKVLEETIALCPAPRMLVITDGGGPTLPQRKRLAEVLGGRVFRVAVVSDSMKVRFIVSSLALLNPEISSFSRRELFRAYEHLGFGAEELKAAERVLTELDALVSP